MPSNDFTEFERDLLQVAMEFKNGKYAKQFLKKQGRKLNKIQSKQAESLVNKKTGNLEKGFKTGKVYKYNSDNLSVRAYNKSPHAHLLNNGHRIVDRNGREKGFKTGVKFMEKAEEQFTDKNFTDTQKFIDNMLNKHGM